MGRISDRVTDIRPRAMIAVAERRFGDAEALVRTGDNDRANGAVYLAGFVIEILLKAQLISVYQTIARKRRHDVASGEQSVFDLIWRQHDLVKMFARLKDLEATLFLRGKRDGTDYVAELKKVSAEWSIHVRYSTRTIVMSEAREI